jgi:hypothetical protein
VGGTRVCLPARSRCAAGCAAGTGSGNDVRVQDDVSGDRLSLIARAERVPLTAHSVAPPRLLYGSLDVALGAGRDAGYTAVYFAVAGSGSLGRITFERLDAVKAARGELLPYDIAGPRRPGDWVFTVDESPWLAQRHHYETDFYSTPLLETCQHYVFEFHDEFIEAIAEGIWLDVADRSRPFDRPAWHPLDQLPGGLPAQRFVSSSGIEWELRHSPRTDNELADGSHLCSQRVWQLDLILDGRTREGASIWLRSRNGLTTSRLVRRRPGGELARLEGQAQPSDFTEAWDEYLAAIAERRHKMGR